MMENPFETAVANLAEDIRNAIELREMLFQRQLDDRFLEEGGTIYYAVDSNVINFWALNTSPGYQSAAARTRVFRGPPGTYPPKSETRVFDIILSHVVNSLAWKERNPLIILPGHDEEARLTHTRLLELLSGQVARAQSIKSELSQIFDKLRSAAPSRRIKVAEGYEDRLHDILYAMDDHKEKLRQFNWLMVNGRLLVAGRVGSHAAWKTLIDAIPGLVPVLSGILPAPDPFAKPGSVEWWEKRLERKMEPEFVEADKVALSTLNRLNLLLDDYHVRVVLITNNTDIIDSAKAYRPFLHGDDNWGRYTFSDLFLRHPKAMLFEADILRPGSTDNSLEEQSGWLDAFLARVTGIETKDLTTFRYQLKDMTTETQLRAWARTALYESPGVHDKLLSEWVTHVDNITLAHVSTSLEAQKNIRFRWGRGDAAQLKIPDEFENQIDALTEGSWTDFFLSAAKLGYEMIGLSAEKARGQKRNVPIIFLRDLPEGEAVLELIYEFNGVIDNETEIRRRLALLGEADGRAARYISAICYALLFAYADKWLVARTLALRAVDIAEGLQTRKWPGDSVSDKVSGREAFYFASVTHRLTARSAKQLEICDCFIAQAHSRLKQDLNNKTKRLSKYPKMTGLRFAAEEVGIQTSRNLFLGHRLKWDSTGLKAHSIQLRKTLKFVASVLDKDCDSEVIRRSTFMNLRTNYFSGLFLLECAGTLKRKDIASLDKFIRNQLSDLKDIDRSEVPWSSLSTVDLQVLIYANSLLPAAGQAGLPPLIDMHRWRKTALTSFLMPYDESRCDKMVQLIQARNAPQKGSESPEQILTPT
jgi:hypothetical protein